MFCKPPIKDFSQSTLNVSPLPELITELTEHNEESFQSGAISTACQK